MGREESKTRAGSGKWRGKRKTPRSFVKPWCETSQRASQEKGGSFKLEIWGVNWENREPGQNTSWYKERRGKLEKRFGGWGAEGTEE